jgi:hypothetical protein
LTGNQHRSTRDTYITRSICVRAARCLFLIAALAGGRVFAVDLPPLNITLVANSDPISGTYYADIWAEGGYAYVGSDVADGDMQIFRITNPAAPVYLGSYPGEEPEDVEVWDGIGYFGLDDNQFVEGGVQIVDLSIPFDPEPISFINSAIGGHDKVHTLSIQRFPNNDRFLYTSDNATDIIKIFDVSDPSTPVLAKSLDLNIVDPPANPSSHEVVVRNNRMYVASKDNNFSSCCGWAHIYDVQDPYNPVLLKAFHSGPRSHTAMPSEDGNLLVVAEERTNGEVHIYDISNLAAPGDPPKLATLNRTLLGIDAHSPHHPHIYGNLLFITWYESGLQVFNISDPENPVRVGHYDTFPGTSTNFGGNWGIDLSGGLSRVLLSDRQRGLFVLNATGVVDEGDYNQDLTVDVDDYATWVKEFGGSGSSAFHQGSLADGNYNGIADAADYVIWRKFFDAAGAGGGESSVPEPGAMLLLIASIGTWIARRRARNPK